MLINRNSDNIHQRAPPTTANGNLFVAFVTREETRDLSLATDILGGVEDPRPFSSNEGVNRALLCVVQLFALFVHSSWISSRTEIRKYTLRISKDLPLIVR